MRHGESALCARAKGCQRPECVRRAARYRKRQRAGLVRILDGDETRAHIAALLAAGSTLGGIGDQSGVSRSLIRRVEQGGRVTRATHAAIMAVAAPARVSALGARRRLQALACAGWSVGAITEHVGCSRDWLSRVRAGSPGAARCTAGFAEAVATTFSALVMTPGPSRRTAAHARREGWAPALAWDDIDHDEAPSPWARRSKNPRLLADPMAVEDVVHFAALGLSDPEIAVRVGLSARTVLRIRQREGIPSLRRSA